MLEIGKVEPKIVVDAELVTKIDDDLVGVLFVEKLLR